ncbi:MAG: 50S ribosomal protein L6 [Candidatus Woesearchaeota archaeon]
MKILNYQETIALPHGVKATLANTKIRISGPKGELEREINDPTIKVQTEPDKIIFIVKKLTKKQKTRLGTIKAHIKNMFKGVTQGHHYKLKICSGHFPMNVTFSGNQLSVKNFLGEKVPRVLKIKQGVNVKIEGDIITLESIDKEACGQTASAIELLMKRADYDKRIFQDGIYIIDKDGKAVK